jgi:hypothetical protein
MATYEESPPDEGYSEDPLTVGQSGSMPPHLARMTVQERTGKGGTRRGRGLRGKADENHYRICDEDPGPPPYF